LTIEPQPPQRTAMLSSRYVKCGFMVFLIFYKI
jgi:hypothetical protein